jgi:hypothetical protein
MVILWLNIAAMAAISYVELAVYVPLTHLDVVKEALASAGAGRIGSYDSCMWATVGTGQFRPLDGSRPFLGQQGVVEKVQEAKIECIVQENIISEVIAALKAAHPYETPSLYYFPVKIE